jgi:hypothetical protein
MISSIQVLDMHAALQASPSKCFAHFMDYQKTVAGFYAEYSPHTMPQHYLSAD